MTMVNITKTSLTLADSIALYKRLANECTTLSNTRNQRRPCENYWPINVQQPSPALRQTLVSSRTNNALFTTGYKHTPAYHVSTMSVASCVSATDRRMQ